MNTNTLLNEATDHIASLSKGLRSNMHNHEAQRILIMALTKLTLAIDMLANKAKD
jgi:hypothetical protein